MAFISLDKGQDFLNFQFGTMFYDGIRPSLDSKLNRFWQSKRSTGETFTRDEIEQGLGKMVYESMVGLGYLGRPGERFNDIFNAPHKKSSLAEKQKIRFHQCYFNPISCFK